MVTPRQQKRIVSVILQGMGGNYLSHDFDTICPRIWTGLRA